MKVARFSSKGGKLELSEIPIPSPKSGELRIKVLCCGICHGDATAQYGGLGGTFPRIPGHEVVGTVDELGEGVTNFSKGDYVGIGWFGGSCGNCDHCLRGEFNFCSSYLICGTTVDGGYAQYIIAKRNSVVRIPKELKPELAGPLMCAGVTTFTALRMSGAQPGALVVIQGLGGLGHLGIQYAKKMGFNTIAVSRGKSKQELCLKLGADKYFDTESQDVVKEIKALGGAKVILSTVTNTKAAEQLFPALGYEGKFILVGALMEPMSINTIQMIGPKQSLIVWSANGNKDVEDTLKFSVLNDIKPVIEEFPLEKAVEAYEHVMKGNPKFRVVLKISN